MSFHCEACCLAVSLRNVFWIRFRSEPRSAVLWTQKLKTHLLRTQSSKVHHVKPGVGQNVAMHASTTARDFVLNYFLPSRSNVHSSVVVVFCKTFRAFPVLAVANTGSCVGPQNKTGHHARRSGWLIQISGYLDAEYKWAPERVLLCFRVGISKWWMWFWLSERDWCVP